MGRGARRVHNKEREREREQNASEKNKLHHHFISKKGACIEMKVCVSRRGGCVYLNVW